MVISFVRHMAILFLCMLVMGIFGVFLSQAFNWDFLSYHFYIPYAYLNDRIDYDVVPAGIQTYFNPLMQVPLYYLINAFDSKPRLIQLIIGSIQGINVFIILNISRLVFTKEIGIHRFMCLFVAVIIGSTGTATVSELGTTMGDNLVSILILAAVYLAMRTVKNSDDKWFQTEIFFSGLLAGFAAGLKLTNLIYLAGLSVAIFMYKKDWKHSIVSVIIFAFATAMGFLVFAAPWMWKMYTTFHNPLFPFYNTFFKSPFWENMDYYDSRFFPRNLMQTLFYPFFWLKLNYNLVTEVGFRDGRIACVLTALVILLVLFALNKFKFSNLSCSPISSRNTNGKAAYILIAFWLISYVLWLHKFSIYRYLVPLELTSGIIIIWIVTLVIRSKILAQLFSISICTILVLTSIYPKWGWDWPTDFSNSRFFSIVLPNIDENSLILLTENDAMSYLIPFFQPKIRFIGIENNLLHHGQENLLQKKVEDTIAKHNGPIYSMFYDDLRRSELSIDNMLAFYKLKIIPDSCDFIISNADKLRKSKSLKFCGLNRM
jgi:hypothetical protein